MVAIDDDRQRQYLRKLCFYRMSAYCELVRRRFPDHLIQRQFQLVREARRRLAAAAQWGGDA